MNDDLPILRALLSYDPLTGEFRWLVTRSTVKSGSIAGTPHYKTGHLRIKINNRLYASHRLAWLFSYGEWPSQDIDHIDGDPKNNRISNLRLVDASRNQANTGLKKSNKSGFKGVRFDRGKWRAQIKVNRETIYLGRFDTAEAAHAAYVKKATEIWGSYARE